MNGPHDQPQHQSGHHDTRHWSSVRTAGSNGGAFLKSNLFVFLLGQFIMFLFWVVGFAVTYGQNTEKNLQMSNWIGRLDATSKRMDEQGTNFSHYGLQADQGRLNTFESRLHEQEEQSKQIPVIVEKVNRIDENIKQLQRQPAK